MSVKMPFCSEVANSLRAVFGAEGINAQIRAGNFYARENGVELGCKAPEGVAVTPVFVPAVMPKGGNGRHGR